MGRLRRQAVESKSALRTSMQENAGSVVSPFRVPLMRVSQIQNLTWTANVLVLAGLGWVGWQFWQTHKTKPSLEWKWPEIKGALSVNAPKDLGIYAPIWSVPIN